MPNLTELDTASLSRDIARFDARRLIDASTTILRYAPAGNDPSCDDPASDDLEAWARHASAANGFGRA